MLCGLYLAKIEKSQFHNCPSNQGCVIPALVIGEYVSRPPMFLTSQGVLRSHTKTLCFAAEAELLPPLPPFSTPNSWTLLLLSWCEEAPLGRWLCEEVVKRRTFLGETQQMEAAVGEDGGRPKPSLAVAALRRRRRFVADVWQV